MCRYVTATGEYIMVRFQQDKARLYKRVGTTLTSVAINYGVTTTMGVKYKVRVEAVGDRVRVWRSPASGGLETLVFDQTGMPTLDGDTVRFQAGAGTVNSYDDLMVLADDAGLSRTTTMAYRANNEIDTATDYNGTTNFTFDAWGRTDTEAKNGTTKTYSWTNANLLAGVTSSNSADTNVSYTYTGDLKRIWRFENSTLTNWYQWDAGFNVLNEFSNVNPMKTFVPGLAEVSGNTLATTADYHYLTTDHLGSTRGMWNQSAAQMGIWEFTPYGSPYNFAGPGDVTQLYTGMDSDRITSQYYAPFRYLNSGIGRWVSQEPLGMAFGTNMYSYVGQRPVTITDPSGLGWLGQGPLGASRNGFDGVYVPRENWGSWILPLRHEHNFYGDPDGDRGRNIGFFNDGFHPLPRWELERFEPYRTGMNDDVLGFAVQRVSKNWPRYADPNAIGGFKDPHYRLGNNNCQNFAKDVAKEYDRIYPMLFALSNWF